MGLVTRIKRLHNSLVTDGALTPIRSKRATLRLSTLCHIQSLPLVLKITLTLWVWAARISAAILLPVTSCEKHKITFSTCLDVSAHVNGTAYLTPVCSVRLLWKTCEPKTWSASWTWISRGWSGSKRPTWTPSTSPSSLHLWTCW